jgi:hypothetical protein
MIKEALLNNMINVMMMIMEWYIASHVIIGRGPGLFYGRVLRTLMGERNRRGLRLSHQC